MLKPLTLDRFSQGLRDPQEAPAVAYCAACSGEIYEGELVYSISGDIIHPDCLAEHTGAVLMSVEDAAGVGA